MRVKEDALEDMQKAHEDQLNKLTALTKEREIAWNKQKEEIEAHYSQLLAEVQSRSKVSHTGEIKSKISFFSTVHELKHVKLIYISTLCYSVLSVISIL